MVRGNPGGAIGVAGTRRLLGDLRQRSGRPAKRMNVHVSNRIFRPAMSLETVGGYGDLGGRMPRHVYDCNEEIKRKEQTIRNQTC